MNNKRQPETMTSQNKTQQPEVSKLRIPHITRQFSRGSASGGGGGGITDSTSQPEMTSLTAARTFEDFAKEANGGGQGPKIASRSYVDGRRGRSKKMSNSPYNKMTSSATMMTSSHSSSSHVTHMDMINDVITLNG